jgi:hypothetical protein
MRARSRAKARSARRPRRLWALCQVIPSDRRKRTSNRSIRP